MYVNYEFYGNKPRIMSKGELYDSLVKAQNGDEKARETLIINNIILVRFRVNSRFSHTGLDTDDLVSHGIIGLIKAISAYDFSKNVDFNTFASKCIDNEILLFLRDFKNKYKVDSLESEVYRIDDEKPLKVMDIVCDDIDIVSDYERKEMCSLIDSIIQELPLKKRKIVELYFGFYDDIERSQQEISELFGCTQSYISRTIIKALILVKKELKKRDLLNAPTRNFEVVRTRKKSVKANSIYEYFCDYPKERVDVMLNMLSESELKLVELRFSDVESKSIVERMGKENYKSYYSRLLIKMRRIMVKLESSDEIKDFTLSKQKTLV